MSNELKKLISKKEIFEQIITLKTKKEVIDFLNENGYEIKDESEIESLKVFLSNLYEKVKNLISEKKLEKIKIDDADLKNVSGGKRNNTNIEIGTAIGAYTGTTAGSLISSAVLTATNAILKKKNKKTLGDLDEGVQWIVSIGSLTAGAVLGGVVGGTCGTGAGYLLDKK